LGSPRPIIKLHPEEEVGVVHWSWARGAPKNWGFPFNISATTEGSDFKIGWWGLPRPIIKSHPQEKDGVALG